MAKALEGVRVIDLTVWFQGPVSAQYLADFGAEVIKVERPQGGDQGRGVRSIKSLEIGDWNQYFLVINRNKKGIAVDLKKPEGQEILYRLVEKSDVFLSNLAPEMLDGWNLSYDKLSAINPRLVYATNTGYGRFSKLTKPSFDMTVQALTGIMARLGEPGQPPIYLGMGSGDAYGGVMSALGIVLALLASYIFTNTVPCSIPAGRSRIRCGTCTRRQASGSTSANPTRTSASRRYAGHWVSRRCWPSGALPTRHGAVRTMKRWSPRSKPRRSSTGTRNSWRRSAAPVWSRAR